MNKADDGYAGERPIVLQSSETRKLPAVNPMNDAAPVPAQPEYFPLDVIAIIKALSEARGTFAQKIASPRLLLTLAAQIPTIILWINGNVDPKYAVVIVGLLTAIYTISEALVHTQATNAAANVAHAHIASLSRMQYPPNE